MADELPLATGGCASNAAVDLARLGCRVGVVGCVGQDSFGRFIIDSLRNQGVDTAGIRQLSEVGTAGTLIINVAGEDRRFIHALGANGQMTVSHIDPAQVAAAKVLYVGGYLLMSAFEPQPLAELFRHARAAGVKTLLDVVLPGKGDHWSRLEPVLAQTDVFLPNRDEAAVITGLDNPVQQAERFLAAGAGTAVITCGGEGTILVSGNRRLRAGVYQVPYIGATGAGDAFDAGYIMGLLAGEDAEGCLRWGSALGASCVRGIGATETVFRRDEAEAFIGQYPLRIESF